jgi:TRAP-type C4-dicarboxylate transport system permease small subunit
VTLYRFVIGLRRVEDWLLTATLVVMLALASGQILLRNIFDSGLIWSEPVLKLLVLWATLLGAMVATRGRNHINIDLITRLLGPRAQRLQRYFVAWFSAFVILLIAYESLRFVIAEYQDGTTFVGSFPSWVAESILPIGFTSIGLRFLLQPLVPPAEDADA